MCCCGVCATTTKVAEISRIPARKTNATTKEEAATHDQRLLPEPNNVTCRSHRTDSSRMTDHHSRTVELNSGINDVVNSNVHASSNNARSSVSNNVSKNNDDLVMSRNNDNLSMLNNMSRVNDSISMSKKVNNGSQKVVDDVKIRTKILRNLT